MRLIAGEAYNVTDWFGMHIYSAEYIGEIQNVNGYWNDKLQFLKITEPEGYRYTACEIRPQVNRNTGEVDLYLHATHYGNNLEELKACTGLPRIPEWKLV